MATISNIFIDGATHLGLFDNQQGSITNSNFPTNGAERGFAKSGASNVDPSTFDRIYFSAFQSNFFSSASPVNNEFKNRMTTPGVFLDLEMTPTTLYIK